jgi:hypothetical protein
MTLLTDIPGVGESIADELRDAGYKTAESVGHANLLNLEAETENVNPEVVLEAQKLLYDEHTNGWNTRLYAYQAPREAHCGFCQKKFTTMQPTPVKVHRRNCESNPDSPKGQERRNLL